jgi:NAD kinase
VYEKIVLVTRKTRLEGLIERFNTRPQARFYIEYNGGNFAQYEEEHESYYAAVGRLHAGLRQVVKVQVIERHFLPNFLFADDDVVVTIGIDGLVVNTAKYLDGQPLVAVNPDPAHIDGILLPFRVEQAPAVVRQVLKGQMRLRDISMAEARLNDGQRLLAFNDLFLGMNNHVSAHYRIQVGAREERHSSSGIIISTGVGATGWLSSTVNMANGLLAYFGQTGGGLAQPHLQWDTDRLVFVVREPFISKTTGAEIVCGAIGRESPLVVESTMAEGGVIFSDGVAADYLAFNAGAIATIGLAAKKTRLVVG